MSELAVHADILGHPGSESVVGRITPVTNDRRRSGVRGFEPPKITGYEQFPSPDVMPINVVMVGRNAIVREGLRRILSEHGFNVLATGPEQAALQGSADSAPPHMMIVDSPSVEEGLDICALLRTAYPEPRLVLIGDSYDLETVSRAFAVGVDGYLVKAIGCDALVGALRLILLGEKVIPSQTLQALAGLSAQARCPQVMLAPSSVDLTERELEILGRLVLGEANKIISRKLLITEATVKVHVKAILRKLQVLNRTQAAIWAVNKGLFSLDPADAYQEA